MKLATIFSLALILLVSAIVPNVQAQTASYDLQFVEVAKSAAFLDVKVQIRSTGKDFALFNANLVFNYTPQSSLSYAAAPEVGAPTIVTRFENFDIGRAPRYNKMTCTTPVAGRVSLNIVHNAPPYTSVGSTWMDVAVVRFAVQNPSGNYNLAWKKWSTSNPPRPSGSTLVFAEKGETGSLLGNGSLMDLSGSLIPMDVISFDARLVGKEVTLNWMTSANANLNGFDVERSVSGDAWQKVGFVQGLGASNTPNAYTFADRDFPNATTLYYRLKIYDRSGQATYSTVVKVQAGTLATTPQLLTSYPNPFNPTVNVHFTIPSDMNVNVFLFDATGKEVARLFDNEALKAGYYTRTWNALDLASGKYLLRMVAGDYTATENLLLNK